MKTGQIILIIILTFLVPMLTSWLLDWDWISDSWPRYTLIVILMAAEFVLGVIVLRMLAKKVN